MHTTPRGMASIGSNNNSSGSNSPTAVTSAMPSVEAVAPTLSEREQLKIEFYKTYDVMTGVRIAATLGGFFSLMVLLVVYKSRRRCKSNRQLEDPRLTAAAEAAVAEAEAEERALAAALEALARQQPKPARGPRRSLCVEVVEPRLPLVAPRFASVGGGGYDSLLAAPMRYYGKSSRLTPQRRCSSITCSSTASSYLERRGSSMVMPSLPAPPSYPRHHTTAYGDLDSWDYYHPIDIQVIQPTPELSPCASEAGLYGAKAALHQLQRRTPSTTGRRAPLASMGSVDPPEPDSLRSLGSDSVFGIGLPDTEDEVSGFSTDSSDGPVPCNQFTSRTTSNNGTGARRQLLKLPPKKRKKPPAPPERWDGCAGCVPRRRVPTSSHRHTPQTACMTISASVDAPRSPVLSTTTSSSQNSVGANGLGSPPATAGPYSTTSPIELRHRPQQQQQQQQQQQPRPNSSMLDWSQETLF